MYLDSTLINAALVLAAQNQGEIMMHNEGVVVVITDDQKKPYREHNFSKTRGWPSVKRCEVLLPFETEFQILVKNNNNVRVKVTVDIDGSSIGSDLVIDANSQCYLERFTDVAKKFKFVPAESEEVSDPTNPKNGVVRVSVQREIHDCTTDVAYKLDNKRRYGDSDDADWMKTKGVTYSCSFSNISSLRSFSSIGSAGATVEGANSNQNFGTTVWKGNDGMPSVFEFKLMGKEIPENDPEYQEYLRLKSKYE